MFQWIKDLRSTEKGKILFKFMLYLLFLFFVVILMVVAGAMRGPSLNHEREESSEESTSILEEKKKTYYEKQVLLYTGKYSFSYEVKLGEKTVTFTGTFEEGSVRGSKETEDELVQYEIEEGTAYQVDLQGRVPLASLYEGMDAEFFDFESVFATLNRTNASIAKDGDKKIYKYTVEGTEYAVTVASEYICEIVVLRDDQKYTFSFEF